LLKRNYSKSVPHISSETNIFCGKSMQYNTVKVFDTIHLEYSTVVNISDKKTNGYGLCLSKVEH